MNRKTDTSTPNIYGFDYPGTIIIIFLRAPVNEEEGAQSSKGVSKNQSIKRPLVLWRYNNARVGQSSFMCIFTRIFEFRRFFLFFSCIEKEYLSTSNR